jgi:glycerophosphoryl diester phosphodiesterase
MSEHPPPWLVAHRGYMQRYPENTWLALQAALSAGACWLEFDVQMCADGHFVLLHDSDFNRTGACPHSAFEVTPEQLQDISVHEPDRFGDRFAPLDVTDLDTVLSRLSALPDCRAMVEIKQESLEHWGLEKVMKSLLPKLEALHGQAVLISYSHEALSDARQHSDIDIGWVLSRYDQPHHEQASLLKPEFLICNENKIQQQALWPGPWNWMVYDVTEAAQAMQWARRGVEFVETRDIGTMLQNPLLATRRCQHGL